MTAPVVRRLGTSELTGPQIAEIRALLVAAFGDDADGRFREADWDHATGEEVNAFVRARFDLGALGTGEHGFYERLGWRTWMGPTAVRTATCPEPTPEEDGYIMVLETPASPALDVAAPISCPWRPGDAW